jgi:hypothetical protein
MSLNVRREAAATAEAHPSITVAVVVERKAQPNRWEAYAHRVVEVTPDQSPFGAQTRLLHDDGKQSRWLYPGFTVALYADECKGYFLNLTSGAPAWFVSWRPAADPAIIEVTAVSLSYIEADRRMAADEFVEVLPLAPEIAEWLQAFTNANFVPDGPQRLRAQSFLSPQERARRAKGHDQDPAGDASRG